MSRNELSTTQVAKHMGVTRHTVGLWCRRGLLPNAHEVDTPRGVVWMIPETDLKNFVRPKATGRPPKAKAETGSKLSMKKGGKK